MKYEYKSKFKIGDKVYYIGLEFREIVIIPCIVDTVYFTNSGVKYYVDKIDDEVIESDLVARYDKEVIISRIEELSEDL